VSGLFFLDEHARSRGSRSSEPGIRFALRLIGSGELANMVPLVSVVGFLLIAVGVWGSAVSIHKDGSRS
jgi:hypothetical protein